MPPIKEIYEASGAAATFASKAQSYDDKGRELGIKPSGSRSGDLTGRELRDIILASSAHV